MLCSAFKEHIHRRLQCACHILIISNDTDYTRQDARMPAEEETWSADGRSKPHHYPTFYAMSRVVHVDASHRSYPKNLVVYSIHLQPIDVFSIICRSVHHVPISHTRFAQ